MIFDFDDFSEHNHRLDLLEQLHDANPAFKCTLFAVPALGSDSFWRQVPNWCELAVHGWDHHSVYECAAWSSDRMLELMSEPVVRRWFAQGFKAPGWQISDGCFAALADQGWWVADQPVNDPRRPPGLHVHRLSGTASSGGDPDHWHGHIQDVCGNGLLETFPLLLQKVKEATSFELISEVAAPW